MSAQQLVDTAEMLVAADNGLVAMDESNPTCDQRLAAAGVAPTRGTMARCLLQTGPAAVPRVAFVSGGQPAELPSARLSGLTRRFPSPRLAFWFASAPPGIRLWGCGEATAPTSTQLSTGCITAPGATRRLATATTTGK